MLGLPYTLHDIAQIVPALDIFQGMMKPNVLKYVVFDTREISHGAETVFVALKTAHRDGHDFIQDALEKGVKNFIVDRKLAIEGINYLLVQDTLEALQMWAAQHRRRFDYPVIAITGSNGKTIVKEWLSILLEMNYQIVKSPMSYNSQIGVAISLLKMHSQADLAIIEAGISQTGEMEILHELIQPDIGILTRMSDAHKEGFASENHKLEEKCLLFESAQVVLSGMNPWWVKSYLQSQSFRFKSIGKEAQEDMMLLENQEDVSGWKVRLKELEVEYNFSIPVKGKAALENGLLCILCARHMGMSMPDIQTRLQLLYPIAMRTEIISDNPSITIINDSYTSDSDSVRQALRLLVQSKVHEQQKLIITDILQLGDQQESIQEEILKEAIVLLGSENVFTIGPVFQKLRPFQAFAHTDQFIQSFQLKNFLHTTVLLKGARPFGLERLIPLMNPKLNATCLTIDLGALQENYRFLKARVPAGTKSMCMVKAAAYGAGTWEIAQCLEQAGADYFAVAYASEGIALRQAGIKLPIMVMNADISSFEALLKYDIEPQIYNISFLHDFIRIARLYGKAPYKIHLKFETGMGRLGFRKAEVPAIIDFLGSQPDVQVISVMSHLAAADEAQEDAFTLTQIQQFTQITEELAHAGIYCFRHILNTAGLLRFPEYAMEMVRMGIGLYGINPTSEPKALQLQEIGRLSSVISHLQHYPAGVSIGYGRSETTQRPSTIATIPIGYADGIPRRLSNGKIAFLVRGQRAPVFGRICMDMLMLDVTEIPEVQVGDEVVLFGQQGEAFISVNALAKAAETIAYEILVGISERVRRVYVRN